MARVIVGAVGLIGLLLAVSGAAAQDIQCGDTLGPGGVFTLPADLECTTPVGLTVRDGAVLDLGGHRVFGGTAILLTGRGAVVRNGSPRGRGGDAVRVAGEGWHTVEALSIPFSLGWRFGVLVTSRHNLIIGNTCGGSSSGFAVDVEGTQNVLADNVGSGQGAIDVLGDQNLLIRNRNGEAIKGFLVGGSDNLLVDNTVDGAADYGIWFRGDGNRLIGNTVTHVSSRPIYVSGEQNVIVRNTAVDNATTDLIDTHDDCDGNRWAHNVFETSQAGDILNPDCIQ